MGIKQSSNHIFMIEPKTFFMNPETLASNHYQDGDDENEDVLSHKVCKVVGVVWVVCVVLIFPIETRHLEYICLVLSKNICI